MGKTYPELDTKLREFIAAQHIYFVGTAPLEGDGHVNVSPKGLDGTFAILDNTTVAYLDYTGSTAETIAHCKQNSRIVIMFCAFEGAPMILRIHGMAEVIEAGTPEFEALRSAFGDCKGARSIIVVKAKRISDSCGYGVPLLEFKAHREVLPKWIAHKSPEEIAAYQAENNRISVDGLPALSSSRVRK